MTDSNQNTNPTRGLDAAIFITPHNTNDLERTNNIIFWMFAIHRLFTNDKGLAGSWFGHSVSIKSSSLS